MLNEVRIFTNVHLSDTQKIVMVRIVSAPNEYVAYETANDGVNLVAALKELAKLQMITLGGGKAALTEQGEQVLKNENIIDDMGELTEEGQKYLDMEGPSEKGDDDRQPQPTATEEPMPQQGQGMPPEPQMSSFAMIVDINNDVLFEKDMSRLKK